jgi:hypothetical protein
VVFWLVVIGGAHAQWMTQHIPLRAGWNAVYLEVQPEPVYCNKVFAGTPVEAVWKWDHRYATIQFDEDPETLLPEDPHWLAWLPPSDPRAFLGRLYALQGGESYLVRVASNAAPFSLPLKGRVLLPDPEWKPLSLNLTGLTVHSNQPAFFADYFAHIPEVDLTKGSLNELYKIDESNRNIRIVQPARVRIEPGRAYWIGCEAAPRYSGPLSVTPSSPGSLDFGVQEIRQDLYVENVQSTGAITVLVRQVPSEEPPAGQPELAGPVALSYYTQDASNNWDWLPLPSAGVTQRVEAGAGWNLQFGIRRGDMPDYEPVGSNGWAYQSIIEVSDVEQTLLLRVPVVAQRLEIGPQAQEEEQGLWVGAVVLDQVNAPAYTNGLLETYSPFKMRLIVHVDYLGQARLLQQAVLAWDAAETNYAIFASATNLPENVKQISRINSAAFPLMAPQLLEGTLYTALTGTVTLAFDDPVNPFLHRYHPMHDNKDWDFVPYTNAVETYTVERSIELEAITITNSAHPAAVDTAAGIYRETLSGLRAQDIKVEGAFYLKRISMEGELGGVE